MEPSLMLYVNLLVGAAGMTIYIMWAAKWWRRKARGLFIINIISALAVGGFELGYLAILVEPTITSAVQQSGFRALFPFVIGAPVLARIFEYRRDQRREQYHQEMVKRFMKENNGVA